MMVMYPYTEHFSGLNLNEAGRIAHLDLHPEELADTVITVGDPGRVALVSQYFDAIEVRRKNGFMVTHTGRAGHRRLSVVATGMGTAAIDVVMNELDALWHMDFATGAVRRRADPLRVLRLGTTSTLDPDIAPGQAIFSSLAFGFDTVLRFYPCTYTAREQQFASALNAHFSGELAIMPYAVGADPSLQRLFGTIASSGIIVTTSGFYAPSGRSLRLAPRIGNFVERLAAFAFKGQKVLNMDMETAAIYGLGRVLNMACGSISLVVTNRPQRTVVQAPEAAMKHLAQQVVEKLAL